MQRMNIEGGERGEEDEKSKHKGATWVLLKCLSCFLVAAFRYGCTVETAHSKYGPLALRHAINSKASQLIYIEILAA